MRRSTIRHDTFQNAAACALAACALVAALAAPQPAGSAGAAGNGTAQAFDRPDEQTVVWGLWRYFEVLSEIKELDLRIEPKNFTYDIGREREGPYGGSAWPVRYRVAVDHDGEVMEGELVLLFYGKDGSWHTRRINVFP